MLERYSNYCKEKGFANVFEDVTCQELESLNGMLINVAYFITQLELNNQVRLSDCDYGESAEQFAEFAFGKIGDNDTEWMMRSVPGFSGRCKKKLE